MNRARRPAVGWVCLLLVIALAAYALQAAVSAPPPTAGGDATGARWLASLAGSNAQDTAVGASGAVGYATPPAQRQHP